MYIEACWLNHLYAALEKYSIRVHGTTKMTPFGMSTNNELIPNNNNKYFKNNKQPKFQVEDYLSVLDKGTFIQKVAHQIGIKNFFNYEKLLRRIPLSMV